jgi:hypothetical protein
MDQRPAIIMDHVADKLFRGVLFETGLFVHVADDLSAEKPPMVDVVLDGSFGQTGLGEVKEEGYEVFHKLSADGRASFADDEQSILIPVRPRKRSAAICSGCHQPAPGYGQSPTPRHLEFIGFWGYLVFLVYCMRRVNCKQCGVLVEEVSWGMGKHTSTNAHMHFVGHWTRKLSWKETAEEFRTSWDKVHDAVAYLVSWGLEHRVLGAIRAIGVDEIQRGKGHKYLTLVYQIDLGCTRLLMKGGRIRTGPDQVTVVPSQAASEPHRQPKGKTERSGALQPPERSSLPAQGKLPATLELQVDRLRCQVPRPMVSPGDALADRADEESCQDFKRSPYSSSTISAPPKSSPAA